MLRYDLSELMRTPGTQETLVIDEPPYEDEDVEFLSPLRGKAVATNTGTVLLVRGEFDTAVAERCSRCLTDLRVPIHGEIEEEYDLKTAEDAAHSGQAIGVVEEEGIDKAFEGKTLLLNVLIRQSALLAVPLQPLCREDCPGIAGAIDDTEDHESEKQSPFSALLALYAGSEAGERADEESTR